MNEQPQPKPPPALDDERFNLEFQKVIDECNARRAKGGFPPLEPEKIAKQWALAQEVRQRAEANTRAEECKRTQQEAQEQQARRSFREMMTARIDGIRKAAAEHEGQQRAAAEPQPPAAPKREAQPKAQVPAPKGDIITSFPIIPATAAAVVNEIASSALFAAIQGKDRKLVKAMPVATTGDTKMLFSGEQLNQDDHDVFMVLVCLASTKPAGEYINVSAHSLLKALGRTTGGPMHKQLDEEIKRLTNAGIEIKTNQYTYIGHLIHDAIKDEKTKQWVYRLNENLIPLYGASCYTLINWEQRKRLKGKDLARWLQLEIARHAVPFPVKVETLRERCGSQAKELRDFRRSLKQALAVLQSEGHIATWLIDENNLLHVDRGAALTASQRRSLVPPSKP